MFASASSSSDAPPTEALTTPPTIIVTVVASGDGTPTAGQSYTLTCSVSGASVTTYQWRKNGTMISETGPTLSFSPLRLSDAGGYTCEVTVDSMTYAASMNITIPSEYKQYISCTVCIIVFTSSILIFQYLLQQL